MSIPAFAKGVYQVTLTGGGQEVTFNGSGEPNTNTILSNLSGSARFFDGLWTDDHLIPQIQIGETTGTITLDSDQTTPSNTFVDSDTPEPVTVAGAPGLLARHDDGFIVEWEDLDTRFTVSIDGTEIGPPTVIQAIVYIEEAAWRELLISTAAAVGDLEALTFTGEGDPPSDVRALLRPGDHDIMTWGRAAGDPWALVTWELVAEGKPTLTCTYVLPLKDEGYCAPPPDGLLWPRAFSIGEGGLVVIYAAFGVDRVSVVSPSGSQIVTIHGETGGYPPTGVLPTSGHMVEGTLTALDANGRPVGEPVPFSFMESNFPETPVGG